MPLGLKMSRLNPYDQQTLMTLTFMISYDQQNEECSLPQSLIL